MKTKKVSEMEMGDVFEASTGLLECLGPAARNRRGNLCMEVFAEDIGQHKLEFDRGRDPDQQYKGRHKLPRVRARGRTSGPASPFGEFR